jgi:hypothetical protein
MTSLASSLRPSSENVANVSYGSKADITESGRHLREAVHVDVVAVVEAIGPVFLDLLELDQLISLVWA